MTKTPVVTRFTFLPQRRASGWKSRTTELKQPFLEPTTGKLRTSTRLERGNMCRRWLVLFLVSFLMACNYYCYDIPAALLKQLGDEFVYDQNFEAMYDLLYSIYSVPNIFLPMVGGVLVDKVGLYLSLNLFSALILAGQLVLSIGCSLHSLPLMLVGRFLFGLGGESISVAQSALVERWFTMGELAFALGASLSLARFGSVINNALSPYVATSAFSVAAPFWFGSALCLVALGCGFLLLFLDRRATESIRADAALDVMPSPPPMTRFHPSPTPSPQPSPIHSPASYSGMVVAHEPPQALQAPQAPQPPQKSAAGQPPEPDKPVLLLPSSMGAQQMPTRRSARSRLHACCASLRHSVTAVSVEVRQLPRPFWLLTLLCAIVYGAVLPFNNVASQLLLDRDYFPQGSHWKLASPPKLKRASGDSDDGTNITTTTTSSPSSSSSYDFIFDGRPPPGVDCLRPSGQRTPFCRAQAKAQLTANLVMSEPYSLSALLTPLLGAAVDRCGGRSALIVLSSAALVVVHLLLGFTSLPASYVLVGLGLGYSIFASVVWPAIPAVVERRLLGTAYGLVTSVQNFGLFVLPLVVSLVLQLTQRPKGSIDPNPYWGVEAFFAALSACGVAGGLLLNAEAPVRIALNTPGGSLVRDQPSPTSSPVGSPLLPAGMPTGRAAAGTRDAWREDGRDGAQSEHHANRTGSRTGIVRINMT